MGFLILFILAGVVVAIGLLAWPRAVWLMGMISGRTGRRFQEKASRAPHSRRLRVFWIVYLILFVLVFALTLYQELAEQAS